VGEQWVVLRDRVAWVWLAVGPVERGGIKKQIGVINSAELQLLAARAQQPRMARHRGIGPTDPMLSTVTRSRYDKFRVRLHQFQSSSN
jgi:hypothetical protein